MNDNLNDSCRRSKRQIDSALNFLNSMDIEGIYHVIFSFLKFTRSV